MVLKLSDYRYCGWWVGVQWNSERSHVAVKSVLLIMYVYEGR